MSGKRMPTNVVQMAGRKHLTKAEIYEREQHEVKTETPKYVRWPSWLPESLRAEFNEISRQLLELNIFTKLDRDTLAQYLIARSQWLQATAGTQKAIAQKDTKEAAEWANLQDKFFKQARSCANDLGLTITSRCRLVVPKADDKEPEDAMEALLRDFA